MKLSYWLLTALLGVAGCSSDTGSTVSDVSGADGDDDDDDGDDDDDEDAGASRKDSGGSASGSSKKDSGGPKFFNDEENDKATVCNSKPISIQPNSPDILIVLDRSASMVLGVDRWTPTVSAVQGLTSALTETVAFGLMVFPAVNPEAQAPGFDVGILLDPNTWLNPAGTFTDPATYGLQLSCDPGEVNVEVDLNTADDIAEFLGRAAPDIGATPTSTTLESALSALNVVGADTAEHPKYVLLMTDGAPTCGAAGTATTPEDVAATVTAIDNLTAAGITTFVVGFGIESDPVAADAMTQFAQHGGTDQYYPVEDEQSLVAKLTEIAGALVPCEFDFDDTSVDDPSYLKVVIDGKQYSMGKDWEWDAENRKIILHPEGGACPLLRDAKVHKLNISRECDIQPVI